ncbi:glycosyltransferase [Nodosilinea sp. FACHB-131]|uniref:glycosyltransferase family 2 protein n=1 Tax=Cyanophyceae TaxID=3028117 RepID=UPI0016882439|nr:glycosyltransferase [Nodosilinea sp. FACHB-131]MBD1872387.1 glycosyltransferase [Nodosilinea sp. FACHB-131]
MASSEDQLISVIVVSDFEGAESKLWSDEEVMLKALAQQDFTEQFEVVLVENGEFQDQVPKGLYEIFPRLKLLFTNETQSASLKDYGVEHTTSNLVAVLEADCPPNRKWLRVLAESMRQNPDIAVVSGRTSYGDETMYKRVMSLLDRSWDDYGKPSYTPIISNNGALYKREVLEKFPYPETITPFLSATLRNNQIRDAGYKFYFEPEAVMRHAIGGLNFVADVRRNKGYSALKYLGYGTGYGAMIRVMTHRWRDHIFCFVKKGFKYLKPQDWPLAILMIFIVPFFEIPGMIDAIKQVKEIPNTSYR